MYVYIHVIMYVYINCTQLCRYVQVCTYVCLYVLYVCTYVCMHVHLCMYMYICTYVCCGLCNYQGISSIRQCQSSTELLETFHTDNYESILVHARMYIYTYIHTYMYIHTSIHTHTHTHTHTHMSIFQIDCFKRSEVVNKQFVFNLI